MYFQTPSDEIANMEKGRNVGSVGVKARKMTYATKTVSGGENLEDWLKTPEQTSKAKVNDTEFIDLGSVNATNANIYNNSIEMKDFRANQGKTGENLEDYRSSRDTTTNGNRSIIQEVNDRQAYMPSITITEPKPEDKEETRKHKKSKKEKKKKHKHKKGHKKDTDIKVEMNETTKRKKHKKDKKKKKHKHNKYE